MDTSGTETITPIQPPANTRIPEPMQINKKKKWWPLALVLLFLIATFVAFSVSQNKLTGNQPFASNQSNTQVGALTPTPIPFVEMTIPYLRAREYQSTLGSLDLFSESTNYKAYTTNYDSDGLRVNGLLTIPSGETPQGGWPAIVFIHGYIPATLYATTGPQYTDYVDYLARNGFVVFKIDLRGHGDSEGEAGGGYYGSDYVVDALNARAALQNADFVNKNAVGMWGHSMAGNILLRSLAAEPTIPGVVIWAGAVYSYVDMQKYGIDDNSYRPPENNIPRQQKRRELFEKYGSPSAQSEFWQQVAPTNYLSDIKGAIEINHAVDDTVVNIGYSRDLMALLDKTSVSHQLFEYPSGGHNISGASFTQAMQRTVEFFKEHLH